MPLAALIAAQDESDSGDGLRATLPLAGRTLIEYQAGLALRAGAEHVVLLVERVPAALAQAAERLRLGGVRIEIARSIPDAIGRFHPEETILLILDGAVAAQEAVDALANQRPPALLALPDLPEHCDFERIDADQRWAGFALIDKPALEATANMLGDWDLSSTLLRRLVQADAVRVDALDPDGDGGTSAVPLLALGPAALTALESGLLRRAEPRTGNWVERNLHRVITAPLVPQLVLRQIDARPVALGGAALAGLGALLAAFQIFWGAALLLPLAAAVAATARRMTRIWAGGAAPWVGLDLARHVAALVALTFLAKTLVAQGGWGWWLLAAVVPAALIGLLALEPITEAVAAPAPGSGLASADALLWLAPPFALLGGWRWMLAALALYAFASFASRFIAAWRSARNYDTDV